MIDPDILASIKRHDLTGEHQQEVQRLLGVKRRREDQLVNRIETQLELLADELEQVMPRTHPKFQAVLMGAFIRRVTRAKRLAEAQREAEFDAYLDGGFPQGW